MDRSTEIRDQVLAALENKTPLAIRGSGSKSFYADPGAGEALEMTGHAGIVTYDPGELIMTCRTGTRLDEVRALLAENGQHLPFEPPAFGETATIGGTVACGFSGPRRPWAGALRDYLLGVRIINGRGEILEFGGQVMKNVAGYDVSRLMAGALGTLGVILETSFKVLPLPAKELTLEFSNGHSQAVMLMNEWSGQPLPLSAAAWQEGALRIRLSGAASEVDSAVEQLKPEKVLDGNAYWDGLREHGLPFFGGDLPLWRISVPPASTPWELKGEFLIDWGGAQHWYRTQEPAADIRRHAVAAGGHAVLFRGPPDVEKFHPLPEAAARLQQRVSDAFDPQGIFNPQIYDSDGP